MIRISSRIRQNYVRRVVVPNMRKFNLKKQYLMIDCVKCHEKAPVKAYSDKIGIIIKFISKRLAN